MGTIDLDKLLIEWAHLLSKMKKWVCGFHILRMLMMQLTIAVHHSQILNSKTNQSLRVYLRLLFSLSDVFG